MPLDATLSQYELDSSGPSKEPLRLMLIGPTGVGKSSTGNTIFFANPSQEKKVFVDGSTFGSKTEDNDVYTLDVLGRQVTVVDTPGISNLQDSAQRIIREIRTAIERTEEPFDALLYVVNCFRHGLSLDNTTLEVFKTVEKTISAQFWKYVVLVFTHDDTLKANQQTQADGQYQIRDFYRFIASDRYSKNPNAIGPYVDKVNQAVVPIENNINPTTDRKHIQEMTENLFNKVEEVKARNRGQGFSKNMLVPESEIPSAGRCRFSMLVIVLLVVLMLGCLVFVVYKYYYPIVHLERAETEEKPKSEL